MFLPGSQVKSYARQNYLANLLPPKHLPSDFCLCSNPLQIWIFRFFKFSVLFLLMSACLLSVAAASCWLMLPAHRTCLGVVRPGWWARGQDGPWPLSTSVWVVFSKQNISVMQFSVHMWSLGGPMRTKRNKKDGPPGVTWNLEKCVWDREGCRFTLLWSCTSGWVCFWVSRLCVYFCPLNVLAGAWFLNGKLTARFRQERLADKALWIEFVFWKILIQTKKTWNPQIGILKLM